MKAFSINNFDLLRLFAAAQVAVCHTVEVLTPAWNSSLAVQLLKLFPGVPIFFFVSGYLISRSYENSRGLGNYSFNRAVRIFPALHLCVLFNILLIASTGYFALAEAGYLDVFLLYTAKTTILQFYNPDFMRAFGDGVLNGSLWTITVELQFYFLTPILYAAFVRPRSPLQTDISILILMIISLGINRALYGMQAAHGDTVPWKLLRVSFAPWLYMFLFGVLCQRHYDQILSRLNSKLAPVFLLLYTGYAWTLHSFGHPLDNRVGPLLFFPLALAILSIAYTKPTFANQILQRNDVSYGIYIYHMPIVNQMLYLGIGGPLATVTAVCASIILALVSWFGLERPLLSRKRVTLHRVDDSSQPAPPKRATLSPVD